MSLKHLYLIDGSGFIFRAYYGFPPMSRPDGTPVNAVYGFCMMINKLLNETDADYVAVIFDKSRRSFRNEIYPEYKANRENAPDDLIPQFGIIREACRAYNIPFVDIDNYEADDLIATYAKMATELGAEVSIVSSDKDLMQLVNENTTMFDAVKNMTIGRQQVFEKFGVYPESVIDVQALAGDSSDNVPGIPGIGVKTAAQLINEFGNLENLLKNATTIKQNKRRENLLEFADDARMSKQLVTLRQDVAVEVGLEHFVRREYDSEVLREFLTENNFKRLLNSLDNANGDSSATANTGTDKFASNATGAKNMTELDNSIFANVVTKYVSIHTEEELKNWLSGLKNILAIDTETTGFSIVDDNILGISMSYEYGSACYIPLNHNMGSGQQQEDLFTTSPTEVQSLQQIPVATVVEILNPILNDPSILKIGQNIKYDISILKKIGISIEPFDDTMLLSLCCDSGRGKHNINDLAKNHLDHECIKYRDVCGTGRSQIPFADADINKATDYACEDADITLRLHTLLKNRLVANSVVGVYEKLERPLVNVITQMEQSGIAVDKCELAKLSSEFGEKMESAETKILAIAQQCGIYDFNVASPIQLSELLFEKLDLVGGKKTKSGMYSTNSDALENIYDAHPVVENILEYRTYAKLKSTYTDALQNQISPNTNRVHTSFNMAGTTTGRLSSSDPNLQNIPARGDDGKKIRSCFVAETGKSLLSLDYSQIELRLVAHMSGDKSMIQAFNQGADIHTSTAQSMFGVVEVDDDMRSRAKVINFGVIYGVSAHGLARQAGCSRVEAKKFIENYFKSFPSIRNYMEMAKQNVEANGFVETMFGRKVHLPDVSSDSGMLRAHAHRQAINSPIQGSAADIIKNAMIKIDDEIGTARDIQLLLQVHDELIFEVDDNRGEYYKQKIKAIMENAHMGWCDISVPLIVDGKLTKVWKK